MRDVVARCARRASGWSTSVRRTLRGERHAPDASRARAVSSSHCAQSAQAAEQTRSDARHRERPRRSACPAASRRGRQSRRGRDDWRRRVPRQRCAERTDDGERNARLRAVSDGQPLPPLSIPGIVEPVAHADPRAERRAGARNCSGPARFRVERVAGTAEDSWRRGCRSSGSARSNRLSMRAKSCQSRRELPRARRASRRRIRAPARCASGCSRRRARTAGRRRAA